MGVPNIFEFATKELTQDALICWLVTCAKDGSGVHKKRGLKFISTLYKHCRSSDDEKCNITDVSHPDLQRRRIDVYFQASINGKRVSFVIEDKVRTSMHDDQLARYLENVREDDEKEGEIAAIYFKTGYVFDDEREKAKELNYCVFDGNDMLDFLKEAPFSSDHEILQQYRMYLQNQMAKRECKLKKTKFDADFVQWKFLKTLRDRLEDCRDEWEVYINEPLRDENEDWIWQKLARGNNTGGEPWTQYRFARHLHWRLDPSYPLRLRVSTRAASNLTERFDVEIWEKWITQFEILQCRSVLPVGRFTRRMNYRGKMSEEGTVGAIGVVEMLETVSVNECVERIAQFHIGLLRSLHETGE